MHFEPGKHSVSETFWLEDKPCKLSHKWYVDFWLEALAPPQSVERIIALSSEGYSMLLKNYFGVLMNGSHYYSRGPVLPPCSRNDVEF